MLTISASPQTTLAGPLVFLPLGSSSDYLLPGFGTSVGLSYSPIEDLPLSLEGGMEFVLSGVGSSATTIAVLEPRFGFAWKAFSLGPVAFTARVGVGLWIAGLSDSSASEFGPALDAGLRIEARLADWRPWLAAGYSAEFGLGSGIKTGGGIGLDLPSDLNFITATPESLIVPVSLSIGQTLPGLSSRLAFSPGCGAFIPFGDGFTGNSALGHLVVAYRLLPNLPLDAVTRLEYGHAFAFDLLAARLGFSWHLIGLGPFQVTLDVGAGGWVGRAIDGSATSFGPSAEAGLGIEAAFGLFRPGIHASYVAQLGLERGVALAASLGFGLPFDTDPEAEQSGILPASFGRGWRTPSGRLSFRSGTVADIPLGSASSYLRQGFGGDLGLALRTTPAVPLDLEGGIDYANWSNIGNSAADLDLVSIRAGLAWKALALGPVGIAAFAHGGFWIGKLRSDAELTPGPLVDVGLRASAFLGQWAPWLELSYAPYLGLFSALRLGLGLAWTPSPAAEASAPAIQRKTAVASASAIPAAAAKKPIATAKPEATAKPVVLKTGPSGLQVLEIVLDPVFPVFFRWYEGNALGYVRVRNGGKLPIDSISTSFFVKQFMSDAKECEGPTTIKPGEETRLPLLALFTDSILGVSEGNTVSAGITLGYSVKGKSQQLQLTTSMKLYDRNATNWSDDRRAAAFVTAKDPLVLRMSKNVAGFMEQAKRFGMPKAFAAALAIFESQRAYGMRYIVDPASSFAAASSQEDAVDFIQFPRQSLDYKAGDCDDLSVLGAALLESIGVSTAFVTVPGHIYIAIDLELAPEEARKRFKADSLIIQGGRSWLPMEVTALEGDFMASWALGAQEWRDATRVGLAAIYPVAQAWTVYPPVGFTGDAVQVQPPDPTALSSLCSAQLERYAEQAIAVTVDGINGDIKKQGKIPRLLNSLGVAYASVGIYSKAKIAFAEATAKEDFAMALVNLGNLAFLSKEWDQALGYYDRAAKKSPKDPKILLAIARANHELENYGQVKDWYSRLKAADPALAARFSYLELKGEEAIRAADAAGTKEIVVWSE